MKIIIALVFALFVLSILALLGTIMGVLATDFSLTVKDGIGWVWQGRKGTAIKEFKGEKDGCVEYVDVWNREGKACGAYTYELKK